MVEVDAVIKMLDDIEQCLNRNNGKQLAISSIQQYKKNLETITNVKIKALIKELSKYNEESAEYHKIAKEIDEELRKIYNKK